MHGALMPCVHKISGRDRFHMDVIILAGGLGTRLRSVIDIPKPIAPINGKPFLTYLLDKCQKSKVKRVCLALGYGSDRVGQAIEPYLPQYSFDVVKSYEIHPLGTGGGILKGFNALNTEKALILNGDTVFDIDLNAFWDTSIRTHAEVSVATRWVEDTTRYGAVLFDQDRIVHFGEKSTSGPGYINGGIYCVHRSIFTACDPDPQIPFSFEQVVKDALHDHIILGQKFTGDFIDIGIPSEYERAQTYIK